MDGWRDCIRPNRQGKRSTQIQSAFQTLHFNLSSVEVCDCRLNFRVKISLDITSIQFNDKGKPGVLLADVLGRLRLPPTCYRVDRKHASPGKIRDGAPQFVDVQTPHIASVTPVHPSFIVAYGFCFRVICEPVDPSLELRLVWTCPGFVPVRFSC